MGRRSAKQDNDGGRILEVGQLVTAQLVPVEPSKQRQANPAIEAGRRLGRTAAALIAARERVVRIAAAHVAAREALAQADGEDRMARQALDELTGPAVAVEKPAAQEPAKE